MLWGWQGGGPREELGLKSWNKCCPLTDKVDQERTSRHRWGQEVTSSGGNGGLGRAASLNGTLCSSWMRSWTPVSAGVTLRCVAEADTHPRWGPLPQPLLSMTSTELSTMQTLMWKIETMKFNKTHQKCKISGNNQNKQKDYTSKVFVF